MDSVIRETILERIKDNEDKRENLIQKITLQDHYDDYFSKFMEFWESSELISDFPIFKVVNFSINEDQKIKINLINTAWDSTLHENAGTKYMPMTVLQENSDPKISGFNIITIEIENSIVVNIDLEQFAWDSQQNMYIVNDFEEIKIDTMRRRINHASTGENNRFFIKESMSKFINDLGAYVVHPRHGNLLLNDIFVYPDFENSLEEKKISKI